MRVAKILPALLLLVLILQLTVDARFRDTDDKTPHILLINSYHDGFWWTENTVEAIRTTLDKSEPQVELYIEYLDTKRYKASQVFASYARIFGEKYANIDFDVIICSDNKALHFLRKFRNKLFPDAPVVFCGVRNYHESAVPEVTEITGVVEDIDVKGTIDLALRLHPNVERVVVVSDSAHAEPVDRSRLILSESEYSKKVTFDVLLGLTPEGLKESLGSQPENSVVLYTNWCLKSKGAYASTRRGLSLIRSYCDYPVYSFWRDRIEDGALGGVVTSATNQGQRAADLALRIIRGESASSIPVLRTSPNVPMFNWLQMEAHGLNRSDLPSDAIVINEPDSFFHRYRVYIAAVLLFLILQSISIALLWRSVLRRRRAEEQARQSEQKFRLIAESAAEGIWQMDRTGHLTYSSPAGEKIFGYSPGEIDGFGISDLVAAQDLPKAQKAFEETIAGREFQLVELTGIRSDGSYVPIEVGVAPLVRDGKIVGVQGITRDTSHRDATRREFESLILTSTDGFFDVDLHGNIQNANDAISTMLGYSREELLTMSIADIEALQPEQEVFETIGEIKEKGTARFETRHRRKDGRLIDVEVSARYLGQEHNKILSFVRDISDRKRAEAEREFTLRLFGQLNRRNNIQALMKDVCGLMREWSGCEAVAIRMNEGQDYPYFETSGFSKEFIAAESRLCKLDENGRIICSAKGESVLGCMCGTVIRGHTDTKYPFFTEFGSFWTNSTSELLANPPEEYVSPELRGRCPAEGYESMALIPLRCGDETIGLLQFNDKHRNRFDEHRIALFERLSTNLALGLEQRRAAVELQESEDRYRALFDASPNSICVVQNGEYAYANPEAARMMGYENPEDVIGVSALDTIAPKSLKLVAERMNRLAEGKDNPPVEIELLRKDGSTLMIESRSTAITLRGEPATLIIGQDISERRKMQGRLRMVNKSLDNSLNGFDIVNEDGKFVYVNQAYVKMWGYDSAEELIGTSSVDHCLDPEEPRRLIEALKHKGSRSFEFKAKRKDGSVFDCLMYALLDYDENGKEIYIGTSIDITQMKQANERLQASEQRFQLAMEATRDGLWDWDLTTDRAYFSPGYWAMLGYEPDELTAGGETWRKLLHPEDKDRARASIAEYLNDPQGDMQIEHRLKSKSGSWVWILGRGKVVDFDDEGRPTRMVGTNTDITARKASEAALSESEEKHRLLLDHAGLGIGYWDLDGNCLLMNRKACEDMNSTADQLVGRNIVDLLDKEMGNKYLRRMQEVSAGAEQRQWEDRIELPTGNFHFISTYTPMTDEQGSITGVQVISENITERKEAEAALRESEAKYRLLFDNAEVLFSVYDRDGVCKMMNNQVAQWFGGKPDDFVGKSFGDLHPETGPSYVERIRRVIDSGESAEFEDQVKFPEGTRWLLSRVQPIPNAENKYTSAQIISQDVTERKLAEQKLRDAHMRQQEAVKAGRVGLWDWDLTTNEVDYSPEWKAQLGCKEDEVANNLEEWTSRIHPDDVERTMRHMDRMIGERSQNYQVEFRMRHADGNYIWILAQTSVICDDSGEPVRVLGSHVDITERKRLEELGSRAKRLELAGTIAGQVAHDFNNLLSPLMAYPEFIREELSADHPALTYVDTIESAAQKMSDINQDLLTMGRRGHYNHDLVDLNKIVRQASQEIGSSFRTVAFELDLSSDLMPIKGGAAQIHRALINLLMNARDAVHGVGQIRVTTENYYADETAVNFGQVPRGEYVKLTISDDGCGIDEGIQSQIFDPFFSTKTADRQRGTGLGLSVVDAVLKDHDGYVDMVSKVGHGTSFFLYFPITRGEISADEEARLSGGEESIMLVDDDAIQREVNSAILRKLGYSVTAVESGEEAVEFLRRQPHDLVMLDMVMPGGVDGTETYRRILEFNAGQRAIVLSGFSESERVMKVQELGAGAFLRKPVTRSTMARAVRNELDRTPAKSDIKED